MPAHDLGASIIEAHSHPYAYEHAAAFSTFDLGCLADVVPHVMWRLPGRPYVAMVFAPAGFDGLAWDRDPRAASCAPWLAVDDQLLDPTGFTFERIGGRHG